MNTAENTENLFPGFHNPVIVRRQFFLGSGAVLVKQERLGQLREELRRADTVVDGHAAVVGVHHVHGDPPAPRGDLIPRQAHAFRQRRGLLHGSVDLCQIVGIVLVELG